MKISEILNELLITDADLAKVESMLGLTGDITDSYTEIEKALAILQTISRVKISIKRSGTNCK